MYSGSNPDAEFLRDKKVQVKLTGDVTRIGKHLHVVNFWFTLLDLRQLDNVSKSTKLQNLEGLTHLSTFQRIVESMGILGYTFWIGRKSKKLKWRTLTGPEKLLLFRNINIPEMFPEVENGDAIQTLWKELLDINQLLSTRSTPHTSCEFETCSKAFVDKLVEILLGKFQQVCHTVHALYDDAC